MLSFVMDQMVLVREEQEEERDTHRYQYFEGLYDAYEIVELKLKEKLFLL